MTKNERLFKEIGTVHDKTNKMGVVTKPVSGFMNNTGADQPAHAQSGQRLCYSLFGKYHM